jgi:hypothetical protein
MRKKHNVRVLEESWMNRRLLLKDIETCGKHLSGFEGFDQSVFVHDSASSCVDYYDAFLHLCEFCCADDVVRVFVEREVQTEDIGLGKEFFKGDVFGSAG